MKRKIVQDGVMGEGDMLRRISKNDDLEGEGTFDEKVGRYSSNSLGKVAVIPYLLSTSSLYMSYLETLYSLMPRIAKNGQGLVARL